MNFAIFRRNFDENLPEFHGNYQEMTKCIEILRKSATKIRKMLEISGICEKISFFISFFHSCPYQSVAGEREGDLARFKFIGAEEPAGKDESRGRKRGGSAQGSP